jgi:MFS family permease
MVQVLPGRGSEAKQLGMLNIANTLPQVLGPLAAAILVTQIGFRALFMFAILTAVAGAICVASIRRVR